MKTLRADQELAISSLRTALRDGYKRPILMMPTGAGKTVISSAIISRALEKQKKIIFTVPMISLIDQAAREFYEQGIRDVGVIQASHPMTDASRPVQIASIQTLQRRTIPKADLVIIDEAHKMFQFVTEWMAMDDWISVPFIGLSATPWTRGLGRLYDKLIISATTKDLINQKLLSPFKVFAPSHPDLSSVKIVAGDFHEGQLAKAMTKGTLTADIVTTWKALGEDRPTLCFAVDCAHAKSIQQQFESSGVSCGYVDAQTPRMEREQIGRQFSAGKLNVVVNVGCLTTGIDWDVRCIILARPTKSEMLYVQMIGRGLRTASGKTELIVLDHSDTTINLGFVTDIHHARLSEGKIDGHETVEPSPRRPSECKKCHHLKPPGTPICPQCGFKAERVSDVEHQDGELIELDAFRKTKTPAEAASKRNRDEGWSEKKAWFAQIKAYAIHRGKSEGWTAHKYREFYGVWPNDPQVRHVSPAAECGPAVLAWINAMNIKFAKSQAKKNAKDAS